MTANPKLLIFVVSSGLLGTLALYVASLGFALRQQGGALLISWVAGSALLTVSAVAPFILRISLADRPRGFFSDVTALYLTFTTMSAFVFPVVIAAIALALSGVLFAMSKVIS